MRRCVAAIFLVGLALPASAADYALPASAGEFELPVLRGSSRFVPGVPQYTRWDGFYFGGQAGQSIATMNFANPFTTANIFDQNNSFTSPLGDVSSWASLDKSFPDRTGYGGFIGYNIQSDEALIGVEANYNRAVMEGRSSTSRCYSSTVTTCQSAITLGDGNQYDVTVNATASARLKDFATLRARGGWIQGNLMSYVMVGAAAARVEITRSATATGTPLAAGSAFTATEGDQRNFLLWGYTAGLGAEYMLLSHIFLRAEYEYVKLNPVDNIRISINTARVGLGVKF